MFYSSFMKWITPIWYKLKYTSFCLKKIGFPTYSSYKLWKSRAGLFVPDEQPTSKLRKPFNSYTSQALIPPYPRTAFIHWKPDVIFFIYNNYQSEYFPNTVNKVYRLNAAIKVYSIVLLNAWKKTIGTGFIYLRGLFIICFIDAMLTDDEPLWEPIEWSLVQSWIMFIFFFGWVAENLITSRYGSYTGRDKRVWFSWYKTFWWLTFYYLFTMAIVAIFIITPFYNETTYTLPYIVSWWNWITAAFFFKIFSFITILLYLAYFMQINVRWHNWQKSFFITLVICLALFYWLYAQFFVAYFAYFTDPTWYSKNRLVDYIQLSHEPLRWGWCEMPRDNFTYHNSKTIFWFKSDGKFAEAFLFCQFSLLIFFVMFFFYWIVFLRRIYTTQELTYTYTTYAVSSLKQMFYFFLCFYGFIFFSFFIAYWRLPLEFAWILSTYSWLSVFVELIYNYPSFLLHLLF